MIDANPFLRELQTKCKKQQWLTLLFSSLIIGLLVRMATDLLTSTIIRTVGSVVATFWGWGGLIVTGTQPMIHIRKKYNFSLNDVQKKKKSILKDLKYKKI